MTWIARTRMAMGRALTDLRAYHLDADRGTLLASKKKRPCTSDVTGLNVIQKTDADIAETDANDTH
ncbi:unnamed protein product [Cylicocyclus nassatus]|uniref:Uncharacterized protein n=1 Tax=Cylicocyclus nassatus TaxID=53992 RepID=A0AA36H3I9_CYLNA|nr:unnamed protein product [Cylicocyclus nassatus]